MTELEIVELVDELLACPEPESFTSTKARLRAALGLAFPQDDVLPLGGGTGIPDDTKIAFYQDVSDHRHGSLNGYTNLGCRCDRCKAANAANCKDYRSRWSPEQRERERVRKWEFNRRRTAAARRKRVVS